MSDGTNEAASNPPPAPESHSALVETIARNLDSDWAEIQSQRAHDKQDAQQWISANEAIARQDRQEGFAELVMAGLAETPRSIESKIERNEMKAMQALGKKEELAMQGIGEAKREAAKAPVSWKDTPTPPAPAVSAPSQGKSL